MPYTSTAIGALTGLGARLLYKGTGSTLGMVSVGVAAVAWAVYYYLIFGNEFIEAFHFVGVSMTISLLIGSFVAWRVSSG